MLVDGKIYATGSRTAAYVGVADSISAAEEISEKEICGINGPLFHREDIGTENLIQRRVEICAGCAKHDEVRYFRIDAWHTSRFHCSGDSA